MTDDELHRFWNTGESLRKLAVRADQTPAKIVARIQRLRASEGAERWPYHDQWPRQGRSPTAKRLKPGASTLPPLASLEGHG